MNNKRALSTKIILCLLLTFVVFIPINAQADSTYNFFGYIKGQTGPVGMEELFATGTAISGTVVYDETVADGTTEPDRGFYGAALISMTVNVDGVGFWSANSGNLSISLGTLVGDRLGVHSGVGRATGTVINDFTPYNMGVDFNYYALPGKALPSTIPDDWYSVSCYIGFKLPGEDATRYMNMGFAPTTAIPEPATLLLLIFGLAGLMGLRRKIC